MERKNRRANNDLLRLPTRELQDMEERKKQLKKDAQAKTTAAQSDHTKVVEHQKSQAAIIVIEERNKE